MHVMWYESKMLNETLDSVQHALQFSSLPVKFKFCLNAQTFIESPDVGTSEDMFLEFINHPLLKDAEIIYKRNEDGFYNATDWRRDIYDSNAKYTVWGESDCLMHEDYFYILCSLDLPKPHIVTPATRKMWDTSWNVVEHKAVKSHPNWQSIQFPLSALHIINLQQLNEFNSQFDIEIEQIPVCKIDASLLAISGGVYEKFIPENLHFTLDDTSAERFFERRGYPQYVIKTRIKGHNFEHPLKRANTSSTRNDDVYKKYAKEAKHIFSEFVTNLYKN
jgi:hypothetical protein